MYNISPSGTNVQMGGSFCVSRIISWNWLMTSASYSRERLPLQARQWLSRFLFSELTAITKYPPCQQKRDAAIWLMSADAVMSLCGRTNERRAVSAMPRWPHNRERNRGQVLTFPSRWISLSSEVIKVGKEDHNEANCERPTILRNKQAALLETVRWWERLWWCHGPWRDQISSPPH